MAAEKMPKERVESASAITAGLRKPRDPLFKTSSTPRTVVGADERGWRLCAAGSWRSRHRPTRGTRVISPSHSTTWRPTGRDTMEAIGPRELLIVDVVGRLAPQGTASRPRNVDELLEHARRFRFREHLFQVQPAFLTIDALTFFAGRGLVG